MYLVEYSLFQSEPDGPNSVPDDITICPILLLRLAKSGLC